MKSTLRFIMSTFFSLLGISLGFILKFFAPLNELGKAYIGLPGDMILSFIQAISIPLITSIIISGLILVMSIKPGVTRGVTGENAEIEQSFATLEKFLDVARNIFPNSLIGAWFQVHDSERRHFEIEADENSGLETVEGTNILGLIFWSSVFGLIFHTGGNEAVKIRETFAAVRFFSKTWLNYTLSFFPFGVLLMISSHIVEFQDWEIISKLGKFIGVVLAGLCFHGAVVLPLIYFYFTKRNPGTVVRKVCTALFSAFLNSSSFATLPLTLQCCEEELGVDRQISRFMLPIGTTIHKNGTALYQAIAVVFIAQLNHSHPDPGQLICIFVLVALIAGSDGIPYTWSMTTFFVLRAVDLPTKGTAFLVVIDCLIDHCNAVVNVFGNCIGVALIHEVSKSDLEEMMESGEEMGRMHYSNAEALHQEDVQLHIRGQAINTQPEDPGVE
ncbi:slc1a3 [Pungitius sinensis]